MKKKKKTAASKSLMKCEQEPT